MGVNCFGCNFPIPEDTKKYFIFDKDEATNKCLVFKIHQITGEECSIDMDESYVCADCHNLLTIISNLESTFKQKFESKQNNIYISTSEKDKNPTNKPTHGLVHAKASANNLLVVENVNELEDEMKEHPEQEMIIQENRPEKVWSMDYLMENGEELFQTNTPTKGGLANLPTHGSPSIEGPTNAPSNSPAKCPKNAFQLDEIPQEVSVSLITRLGLRPN